LETQNKSTEYALIDKSKTPCFSVNRIDVKDRYIKESDSFYIGIVTKGCGTIMINGKVWPVVEGSKFFVPYQTELVTFESEKTSIAVRKMLVDKEFLCSFIKSLRLPR